ncbi:MAG: trigger factor [Anaerolineae bacterium]|nr:trigger factor [Anaerolineae bacterium]
MKVITEELERCQVLVTVEIDTKKEKDLLQKAAKRIAKEVRIPGFRPGKAPYNVIVRRFGLEAIQQEALEKSADNLIQKALEEADVTPFAQMDLDSISWDPLVIKLKVPTEPKVELSDYRDIRLDFEEIVVTDEDVEERLEQLQKQNATWTEVERPSQLHDQLTISVVEKAGDEVLSEHESIEYELHPFEEDEEDEADTDVDEPVEDTEENENIEAESESDEVVEEDDAESDEEEEEYKPPFRPDLTTPLLGLSADEETTFSITYPDDHEDERYAGKEVTFEIKVFSVKEKELPNIDDDFAKTVSDFDTLDELKADTEEKIKEQRLQEQNNKLGNEVLEKIIEESDIEWPKAYEDETIDRELSNYERQIAQYGLSLDNYLSIENKTREDFIEESRERVVSRLKRSFVIREISKAENIKIGEGEILQHAKLLSDLSGQGDQLWREILSSPIQQELIANDLMVGKIVDWLAAIAKGEDPQPAVETEDQVEGDQTAEDATDADASPEAVEANTDEVVESESSEATASDEEVEPERESSNTETDADVDQTEEPTPAGVKS